MSDWGGTHSTVAAAVAGLDQEMPDDQFFGPALLKAVQNGSVPESVLDDKVLRILTGMYTAGIFDRPTSGALTNNVTSDEHNRLARWFAANAIVLLENNGVLPLPQAPLKIAVRLVVLCATHWGGVSGCVGVVVASCRFLSSRVVCHALWCAWMSRCGCCVALCRVSRSLVGVDGIRRARFAVVSAVWCRVCGRRSVCPVLLFWRDV